MSYELIVVDSCSHGIPDKVCCVYFASWGNSTAGALLPLAKHNCLKWFWQVQNA